LMVAGLMFTVYTIVLLGKLDNHATDHMNGVELGTGEGDGLEEVLAIRGAGGGGGADGSG